MVLTPHSKETLLLIGGIVASCAGCSSQGTTVPLGEHMPDTTVAETTDESPPTSECDVPDPAWIWCDDFRKNRLEHYFEYDDRDGSFVRVEGVGKNGSPAMEATFSRGQVAAGSLKLALGATPSSYFASVDSGTAKHQEIHWRFYLRNESSWEGGGGNKLTRATSFTGDDWTQAMIAHVWSGSPPHQDRLVLDPASGVPPGSRYVQTRRYNDFPNLRWLGIARASNPIFDSTSVGSWYCIEIRARLNTPGNDDGEFELWIDGVEEASARGLDWMGDYSDFGLNAIFLENYWDDGAPREQRRYFDHFVVSQERIGCLE